MSEVVVHVVSNTSPLNYLLLIDEIGILPQLYGRIRVPQAVMNELSHPDSPSVVRSWAVRPPAWTEIVVPAGKPDQTLQDLGAGERDAILLTQESSNGLLIIDERAGTREAEKRGVLTTSTLGVLDQAAYRGLVDIKQAMSRLQATNFRIRRDIVESLVKKHESR